MGAAVAHWASADAFATQGDVWDTQKDMAMAGIGAVTALALFSRPSTVRAPGRALIGARDQTT